MAKVRGPLLSLSAQGQIGKSLVSASWRGVPYMRQYVVPSNPRSVAQTLTRDTFKFLDDMYKRMLTLAQAPWIAAATGRPFTARNAFLSSNVAALRGDADMTDFVGSPGVKGGLPGENPTATGGAASGEIDATIDVGQLPVDWNQTFVTFLAFPDRDPATQMVGFVTENQETGAGDSYTPPQTISTTFTGLEANTLYHVSIIPQWTRADGTIAYGPSSELTATSTA